MTYYRYTNISNRRGMASSSWSYVEQLVSQLVTEVWESYFGQRWARNNNYIVFHRWRYDWDIKVGDCLDDLFEALRRDRLGINDNEISL